MSINHRERRHAEIESVIGIGELDRLTDESYDSALAGLSVDRIGSLPKDFAMNAMIDGAIDGLKDGYIKHVGYCVRRQRRYFSVWAMVEGKRAELLAAMDRLREDCDK